MALMNEVRLSDQELLLMLQEGDRAAFDVIYLRYWRMLCDAAYRRLSDRQQSEDIVQEIFIRLWVRRAELSIDDLPAYLKRAVKYQVFNYVTRNKVSIDFYEPFALLLSDTATADGALLAKEVMMLVEDYAATLPERRREIFLLHMQQRLSTREIAERLNLSQKTVQNQLLAAMPGLRTRIAPVVLALLLSQL